MEQPKPHKLNILRVDSDEFYNESEDKSESTLESTPDTTPDTSSDKLSDSADSTNIPTLPSLPPKPISVNTISDNPPMAPRKKTRLSLICNIPEDSETLVQSVDDAADVLVRISKDLLDIKKGLTNKNGIEKEIKTIKGDIRDLVNESMLSPRARVLSRLDAAIGNTQMLIKTLNVTVKDIQNVSNMKEDLETRDMLIMKDLTYIKNKLDYLTGEVDKIEAENKRKG